MNIWIRCALLLSILLGTAGAQAEVPTDAARPAQDEFVAAPGKAEAEDELPFAIKVPELKSPVTDLTGTLDSDWIATMKQRLLALQQRKGSQIAILMLPSTGEDSIEQFATRVFEQWRLGRQGVDDGVLVLVAKDDRTMRIEVGYGLEGGIPDVVAGRIIREEMKPAFREGDFAGGIERSVDVLERLIDGETLPEERHESGLTREGWLFLMALGGGFLAGIAAYRRWLVISTTAIVSGGLVLMLSFGAGLKSAPAMMYMLPFCWLLGGGVGALSAYSRKFAWFIGCGLAYLLALGVVARFFGNEVLAYGIFGPLAGVPVLVLLSLPFIFARAAWKRGRLGFCIRALIALGISAYLIYSTGILVDIDDPTILLGLIPMIYFPALFCFLAGTGNSSGRSSSSSSGGGSSGGGSSYSGGGGSSGGGGASGSW